MTPELPPINSTSLPAAVPAESVPFPEPAPPPRWSLVDLGLFIGLGVLAFLLALFLVRVGFQSLRAATGGRVFPEGTEGAEYLAMVFQIVFYLLLFAAIYAMVAIRDRLPFWQGMKWKRLTFAKVLAFLAVGAILAVAVQLAPTILPDRKDFPLQELFSTPALAYALGAFAVVVAPWMEELVFRGVLFAIFEDTVGLRFAILTSAVLFTAMHIPEYRGAWNHIFLLLIVGLVFSLARGMTGSLAPSVVIHISYNFCQVIILFIATNHFRTIQSVLVR